MNKITAISQITAQDVADYLRIAELTQDDINTINTILDSAKKYIEKYTGQSIEDLDECQDVVIVVLILCQDMYDNRTYYVEGSNVNKVVESILGLHEVNLL